MNRVARGEWRIPWNRVAVDVVYVPDSKHIAGPTGVEVNQACMLPVFWTHNLINTKYSVYPPSVWCSRAL